MIGLIQRVSSASVAVDGETVADIGNGILLLLGVEREDTEKHCHRLAERVLNYRIFPDLEGKMNLSVKEIKGELLVVSQFTLAADTRKGLRPSFTPAGPPQLAEALYEEFIRYSSGLIDGVVAGRFGADMKVSLCNDGPVTFLLEVKG